MRKPTGSWSIAFALLAALSCATASAQVSSGQATAAEKADKPDKVADTAKDALGRTTPRGTVFGFLAAARKGDFVTAAEYLQVAQKGDAANALAKQLFIVLDSRLPTRLNQISDSPDGSLQNPLRPDRDSIATIASAIGPIDIQLARSGRGRPVPVWLFSRETLDAIPDLYDEVSIVSVDAILPPVLVNTRILGVRLYGWLTLLVALPLLYLAEGALGRALAPAVRLAVRRPSWREALSGIPAVPAKLLVLALIVEWTLTKVGLGLIARQFWAGVATALTVGAVTWLLLALTRSGERLIQRRSPSYASGGTASLLRLGRRGLDLVILIVALVVVLGYFGIDATAALAGLGVGGIAVALAAQKTLENVIAGVSLVADQAVRVGDFLTIGDVTGTVQSVGLRSTTIRTLDRTVVMIPNGQVAAVNVENMSDRDKFWLHPMISLRTTTPPDVIAAVVAAIEQLLAGYVFVERESIRVRFLRIGPYSFDIEVFAYVFARDWNRFLEVQQELLIATLQTVRDAGGQLALPAQSIQIEDERVAPDLNGAPAVSGGGYPVSQRRAQAT